jgi:hypothetical protein
MIVTEQQSQNLHQYLSGIFSYRETMTEVYDHLLSAFETYDGPLNFEDAVNAIIKTDFGGKEKLYDMEKRFTVAASREIRSQLWSTFLKNLKLWGGAFGLVLFIISFYYRLNITNKDIVFGVLAVIGFASFLLSGLRTFRSGYLYGMKKNSVKDRILIEIGSIPTRFLLIAMLLNTATASNLLGSLSPNIQYGATLIVYTALSIFLLSYYQCFHKEYSLKAINN